MRLKAKMAPEQVQLLYNVVTPVSRLTGSSNSLISGVSSVIGSMTSASGGGRTVMYFDPDHVRISTRGGGGTGTGGGGRRYSSSSALNTTGISTSQDAEGISCFIEFTTENGIFLEHRIESVANNVIVFEIDLTQLRMALQSVLASGSGSSTRWGNNTRPLYNSAVGASDMDEHDGDDHDDRNNHQNKKSVSNVGPISTFVPSTIIIKLAKRSGGIPCLCLDAMGGDRGTIELHHAIPVRIMRAIEMQYHLPPRINMPTVQLELPGDRPLRTVIERLRYTSPHLYLEGSMAGELVLRLDSDGVSIRTFYNKLIPRFEDSKPHDGEEPAKCTLKVDTKKLLAALNWQNTLFIGRAVSSAVLCMVENEMLVLHVMLNPSSVGFFTFYVPVHFLSDEWN